MSWRARLVAHSEPTRVEKNEAIWGPWTDSLEPVTWRFRVSEVGQDEYEYRLEGRPKASDSDGDYRAVLFGTGFGVGTDIHTGPNGNLFVVSLTHGAIYEIFRRGGGRGSD